MGISAGHVVSDRLDQLIDALSDGAGLPMLEAAILASAHLGLVSNSRDFSKHTDIAHALVIRACVDLENARRLLVLDRRDDRSQRVFYHLSSAGQALVDAVSATQEQG